MVADRLILFRRRFLDSETEKLESSREKRTCYWAGLVCVYAQEQLERFWAKRGFMTDDGMGRWWEEGIPHVGMFQRLSIVPEEFLRFYSKMTHS